LFTALPPQLIQSLQGATGFDQQAFENVHANPEQVTSVRANPAKISAQQFAAHSFMGTNNLPVSSTLVPWCAAGHYLSQRPSFTFDPWLHAGAYYVQEASSMFLHHALQAIYKTEAAPATVLDLCAAPGGKSTLLASALPNSFIVSNEVIKNRVTILAENISKWGSDNVVVTHNDPRDFARLPGFFDCMVVDAPCSGSGLFRKDPKAINEWSEDNVTHCSLRQQRILANVLPALKTGGHLLYSTCSYSPAEDEAICDWLIQQFGLESVPLPTQPTWGIVETFSKKKQAAGYRFYPDKVKGEGFFIACFVQTAEVETAAINSKYSLTKLSKTDAAIVEPWLTDASLLSIYKQKETIIAFPQKWLGYFMIVQQFLHTRKSGVAIGVIKGSGLVPHHELALSQLVSKQLQAVELDYDNAIKYLRRSDLLLQESYTGWTLACYQHLAVGWMKLLGNRINNYYPTEWRILKPYLSGC